MDQLGATLRKLRSEADDCELISCLTGDSRRCLAFSVIARDLRAMARQIEVAIAERDKRDIAGGLRR